MSLSNEERELRCVLSWFSHWDEQQKENFLSLLVEKAAPPDIQDLFEGLSSLSLSSNCLSVYQCQVKLFNQWFDTWTHSHRNRFLFNLQIRDQVFVEKFHTSVRQRTGGYSKQNW